MEYREGRNVDVFHNDIIYNAFKDGTFIWSV